jgi:crotonobetainyl-CoA:carnitine CoA-transferase CaiB-like acyl-CoA transferase
VKHRGPIMPPVMPGTDAGLVSEAYPPLSGVRVIEIGRFAAGPACATVLADWGADVVKIEPPGGDPARGRGVLDHHDPNGETNGNAPRVNPRFEVHNRSRRSIVLDLRVPAGRTAAGRLIATADVLVTNLSPAALEALELDAPTLRARYPRLIVAQVSGYDPGTPQARERSYDHGAYWSYSGAASLFTGRDGQPPQPAGGFGDRAAGSMLAGAVAAALLARERTGTGSHVTTSLVSTGMWLMASDVGDVLATGRAQRSADRRQAPVPTVNCFRTSDARWLWLQVMDPDRDWPRLVAALDAPWLEEDPRFRGGDYARLRANREALTELLDELFRARPLAEWAVRLAGHQVTWAPVRTLEEAVTGEAAGSSPAVVRFDDEFGRQHVSVNSPVRFDGATPRPATRAPEAGENTLEVLASAGLSDRDVAELSEAGALGTTAATVVTPAAPAAPAAPVTT